MREAVTTTQSAQPGPRIAEELCADSNRHLLRCVCYGRVSLAKASA